MRFSQGFYQCRPYLFGLCSKSLFSCPGKTSFLEISATKKAFHRESLSLVSTKFAPVAIPCIDTIDAQHNAANIAKLFKLDYSFS